MNRYRRNHGWVLESWRGHDGSENDGEHCGVCLSVREEGTLVHFLRSISVRTGLISFDAQGSPLPSNLLISSLMSFIARQTFSVARVQSRNPATKISDFF